MILGSSGESVGEAGTLRRWPLEEAQIAQAHHPRYVGTVHQDGTQLPVEGMMRVITVLNRCTTFKRFVFEGSHFDRHGRMMVRPRKNSRGACSRCGHLAPTYDTATEARLFEFVPLWGFPVFLVYRMRRVACKACGRVVVEKVPWSTGKHHLTDLYRLLPGTVGQKAVVDRGGALLPDQLGQGLPFRPVRRGIWARSSPPRPGPGSVPEQEPLVLPEAQGEPQRPPGLEAVRASER